MFNHPIQTLKLLFIEKQNLKLQTLRPSSIALAIAPAQHD